MCIANPLTGLAGAIKKPGMLISPALSLAGVFGKKKPAVAQPAVTGG